MDILKYCIKKVILLLMKQTITYIVLVLLFVILGIGAKTVYVMYQNGDFEEKINLSEKDTSEVDMTINTTSFYDSLEVLSKINLEDELESLNHDSVVNSEKPLAETIINTEKETNTSEFKVERDGSLFKTPFYIVSISAVSKKEYAIKGALRIQKDQLNGNFLWIPDYSPNGKKLYKIYVGPFASKLEAQKKKEEISSKYPGCYVQTIK